MSENAIQKALALGFILFTVAIIFVAIGQPYGAETKIKAVNSEVISALISPLSAIIGAMLRGISSDKDKK